MKAIRVKQFGGPEVLEVEEVPVPIPGPGQVLVRVFAAGVNPVDTYIRAGIFPSKPRLPYTPGMDGAGEIAGMGRGVRGLKLGMHVYITASLSGTYAGYAICDPSGIQPLPRGISYEQGAAIGIPYATAWQALFHKGQARRGETVLIHGASGGVGIAAIQTARLAGLRVLATAGSSSGLRLVKKQGAHAVFNHCKKGYLEKVMASTRGRGVNLILEMLANVNLERDLNLLSMRGRVVVIGCRGTVEINPRLMMGRDSSVTGMLIFNATENEKKKIFLAIHRGLKSKKLWPVIGKKMRLTHAVQAHRQIMNGPAAGKMILIP